MGRPSGADLSFDVHLPFGVGLFFDAGFMIAAWGSQRRDCPVLGLPKLREVVRYDCWKPRLVTGPISGEGPALEVQLDEVWELYCQVVE